MVLSALFTALIAAGSYLVIPLGPVPLAMQNFFVILAGLLLPPGRALSAVGLYLILGGIGLPLFAGGSGGIAHLVGPTGGYLFSYLPAVAVVSLMLRSLTRRDHGKSEGARSVVAYLVPAVSGVLIIYLPGVPWLKFSTGLPWSGAISAGMLPFLPGDLIKAVAAALVARPLRQRINDMLSAE